MSLRNQTFGFSLSNSHCGIRVRDDTLSVATGSSPFNVLIYSDLQLFLSLIVIGNSYIISALSSSSYSDRVGLPDVPLFKIIPTESLYFLEMGNTISPMDIVSESTKVI